MADDLAQTLNKLLFSMFVFVFFTIRM